MAHDYSNKSPPFVVAMTLNAIATAIARDDIGSCHNFLKELMTEFSAELGKLKPAVNFQTPRTNASVHDGIRTDEQPYMQLSGDDLVTAPDLSRVGTAGKRYTLQDLSQAYNFGMTSSIETLNPRVTKKLISDCFGTWAPPIEELLVAVDGKLREFVHQVINEHMGVHPNTLLSSEVSRILTGVVNDAIEQARSQVQYQLKLHREHVTTCDQRFPSIHENRKVFRAARENQRLKERPETRPAIERLETNKRRRTLNAPSEQNHLGPDKWAREVDGAAYTLLYYNFVFPQFVDNVLRIILSEMIRPLKKINSTLIEQLNLRDEARCVELLAERVVGSSLEAGEK